MSGQENGGTTQTPNGTGGASQPQTSPADFGPILARIGTLETAVTQLQDRASAAERRVQLLEHADEDRDSEIGALQGRIYRTAQGVAGLAEHISNDGTDIVDRTTRVLDGRPSFAEEKAANEAAAQPAVAAAATTSTETTAASTDEDGE